MHIEDGSAKRATEASNLSPAVTTHDGAQEDKKFDINLNQIQSVREGGLVLERSHLKSTRFGIFSCLAIQFATTAPPLAISLYSGLITGAGGSPFFFWGFIVAFIGQLFMAMSLAEISSSYPQTTAQTYWVAATAPKKHARFFSYLAGIMSIFGWIYATAATFVYTGEWIAVTCAFLVPTYSPEKYQILLILFAAAALVTALNTVLMKAYGWSVKIGLLVINIGALFIFISLLAKVQPKADAHTAFVEVVNETGWSSNGLVFLFALLPGVLTVSLFDAAAHLAEEMPQPERQVPIVMISTACLNGFAALLMVIAIIFCTTKPENLLEPIGGFAILQIAYDAWPSMGFLLAICFIYIFMQFNGSAAITLGCSRLIWSFSQTGGMFAHKWHSSVNDKSQIPTGSVITTTVLSSLAAILLLGPATVLNGLFGASIVCMVVSYSLPIGFVLYNGRSILPANRYWNLGKAGPFINVVSILWGWLAAIVNCIPQYVPVTSATFNWAPIFFGITAVLVLINWLFVRKRYQVPVGLYVESLHGHRLVDM